jgi:ABC-2 type transport system permease protein
METYLYRNALQDLLRPRKMLVTSLLIALPAVIAFWQMRSNADLGAAVIYGRMAEGWIFQFVLVMLCVIYGTGIVANEVEQKTVVYLLTRPVPRWRILLPKYLAACTAAFLSGGGALLLTALATYGGKIGNAPFLRDAGVLLAGVLVYTALFLLMGTILTRPLIVGLLFGFGWETWVPNMPGSFSKFSLISYLRALTPHDKLQGDAVDISKAMESFSTAVTKPITSTTAWMVLLVTLILCLSLSLMIFSSREYVPRDDVD